MPPLNLPEERDLDWDIAPADVIVLEPADPPVVILENPKPYRGAVAKAVLQKMGRENAKNTVFLLSQGAKEQAWTQFWSNFTKTCYAVGVPVDTNADLRI